MNSFRLALFSGLLLCAAPAVSLRADQAKETGPKEAESPRLTIERIFEKNEFGSEGHSGRWIKGWPGYLRQVESAETKGGKDIVMIDPESGATNIVVAAQDLIPAGRSSPLSVEAYDFSDDRSRLLIFTNSKRVWRRNDRGDYWILDRSSLGLRQLGGDAPPSSLMHAKLSPDGRWAGYVRDRNIYVEELRTGDVRQLTRTPNEELIHGVFDWVYEEEFGLHDGWRWSPAGDAIAFWQTDTSGVRAYPLIDYTAGLYPEIQWIRYPKTGEQNSAVRLGVVRLDDRNITWLDLPGDPRNHYPHWMEWPEEAGGIVVQQLNRLQNTNAVFVADPATGEASLLFRETDAAWVDVLTDNRWAGEGKAFPWLSERGGWRQLYRVNAEDGRLKQVYDDSIDVVALEQFVAETGDIYFIASPDDATQHYLYRANLSGGRPQRITPADQPGTHSYNISPDGRWAIHTRSSHDEPPIVDLVRLPGHEVVRVLEKNEKLNKKLEKLERSPVEFFRVKVADGVQVDAYCVKPPDFDPTRKYPAIVYVYGEPAGQTVRDSWGGSGGLWNQFLAQQGFVVLSFDNRGTPAPRGRDWRKSVYRQVGILAAEDQVQALRTTLAERPYLDPGRVGIWGWSGGGSMTLNALFKYPDDYAAGIAVAAVPNMRLYDTIYQERYMGLPDDNVAGYREGSPLFFAHQFKGRLLLVHGTGDDNVHYQGFEVLVDRLVHSGKQFESLAYPNRSHGIGEGQNTTLHLRRAMWDFWQRTLLQAAPAADASPTAPAVALPSEAAGQ
ncbi:MAG TPA: S9 family peptidase [Verrucomicrobiales bacterium]|nr:S9 family peptidase [Verrucomicrobiales bacterium]